MLRQDRYSFWTKSVNWLTKAHLYYVTPPLNESLRLPLIAWLSSGYMYVRFCFWWKWFLKICLNEYFYFKKCQVRYADIFNRTLYYEKMFFSFNTREFISNSSNNHVACYTNLSPYLMKLICIIFHYTVQILGCWYLVWRVHCTDCFANINTSNQTFNKCFLSKCTHILTVGDRDFVLY